eukprot:401067-Amphidinium_carterae.1
MGMWSNLYGGVPSSMDHVSHDSHGCCQVVGDTQHWLLATHSSSFQIQMRLKHFKVTFERLDMLRIPFQLYGVGCTVNLEVVVEDVGELYCCLRLSQLATLVTSPYCYDVPDPPEPPNPQNN